VSLLEVRCRLAYPSGFALDADFATDAAVTSLFGPSGSGKTSILSIIAGLRRPDDGCVRLGTRVLYDRATRICLPPEDRRIGYVFQDQLLFPHLSVRRNLLYGWRRRPRGARATDFSRVVEVLELGGLLERRPHTLSGGQRQRVALGRALLCGPELLLLDEPVAALEEPLKERILDHVAEILSEWRIPTLYVSHQPEDVRRLAGRVITLQAGRVVSAVAPAGGVSSC
jgi:molybdate transport system ATP-binding protein